MGKAELLEAVLQLSEADRLDVAGRLLDSVEGPAEAGVEAAWADEIARRIKLADEGSPRMPWAEARKRIAGR